MKMGVAGFRRVPLVFSLEVPTRRFKSCPVPNLFVVAGKTCILSSLLWLDANSSPSEGRSRSLFDTMWDGRR